MLKDDIQEHIDEMRLKGITSKIRVVPIVSKRCLVPCEIGRCNCYPIDKTRMGLVTEENYESAMKEFLENIIYFQEIVDKLE